jgi:hypothetical protein
MLDEIEIAPDLSHTQVRFPLGVEGGRENPGLDPEKLERFARFCT